MNIKIEEITLHKARKDQKLMRILYGLTLKGTSNMRYELKNTRNEYFAKQYIILLAKINDKIVGWALMYPSFIYAKREPSKIFYYNVYVSKSWRRVGVGKKLFIKAQSINKKKTLRRLRVSPHDDISASFFTDVKAITRKEIIHIDKFGLAQ